MVLNFFEVTETEDLIKAMHFLPKEMHISSLSPLISCTILGITTFLKSPMEHQVKTLDLSDFWLFIHRTFLSSYKAPDPVLGHRMMSVFLDHYGKIDLFFIFLDFCKSLAKSFIQQQQ